ncbi:MAG: gliding motility lipoprotein GldH [Bacteroidales bacterium]|jgi:gliding motility-associated lipoprotein GldH|nr:gliding motility lipoprotein GldH [Bacteroidales bacterium]
MFIKPEKKSILFFILFMVILAACDPKRVFDENKIVENGNWNVNNKLRFNVPVEDIISHYNFYLYVRNAVEYPFSNLFIFITTTFPDGRMARDTVELTLAGYDGRWLGSGMGNVKYNKFLFQKGVQFKQKGNYRFEFEQAMRINEIKGIRDIGLRIEKE